MTGAAAVLLSGLLLVACTAANTGASSPTEPASLTVSEAVAGDTLASQSDSSAGAGECNAEAAKFAIGEPPTSATVEAVRARSTATILRVLRDSEATTREFIAGRVNIHLDANGRIAEIRCG